ncbi:MAG: hypothetical protein ACKVQC_09620 [Elusimicrobiota bacterium]
MKKYAVAVFVGVLSLGLGGTFFAHDEGHGPKLTDQSKQGGVIAPVIDEKDAKKGAKAAVVYKAELVRSDEGIVRLYLYDIQMNVLDISKFEKTAKGIVEVENKKKYSKTPFDLKIIDDVFTGSAPKASRKPFNIDVHLKEGTRSLLVAFDNLD